MDIQGLAPHTLKIFEEVSKLECIKDYTLVGGTALALQLATRLSEDLDFMSWRKSKNEKREVDWPAIKKGFESIGDVEKFEIYDLDHIEFVIEGVKISFYANPHYVPEIKYVPIINNLKVADPIAIGAMKMEVMLRRSKFRDYYDIYALMEHGYDINKMIDISLRYSGHRLKKKNLLAMLTRGERFVEDEAFQNLAPVYSVTSKEIEERIKRAIGSQS